MSCACGRFAFSLLCVALAVGAGAGAGLASETAPVTLEAPDDLLGDTFPTGFRTLDDLLLAYEEQEYFVSGEATVYTYAEMPVRGEKVVLTEDVPYKTRMIVRRPVDPTRFNGTVVIEWWNSTAGFDTSPGWDASAEYFGRVGIVYVGVTNSTTSMSFLTGGCMLFGFPIANCGTRYVGLTMPENGQAFEIMSQIANLLKHGGNSPLPEEFEVERIFHVGQSQQGGSVVTYANDFHFDVNDGYFIQAAGTARPINFQPDCAAADAPSYPACTPRLQGEQSLVRRDLPVPVYRAQTETDMAGVLAGDRRQEDSGNFRYYEMAGTAHTVIYKDVVVPVLGTLLEDFCEFPMNALGDGPVFGSYLYNAMWNNMEKHVRYGTLPPHGSLIVAFNGVIARDQFGNARGGIRLPMVDVPLATYGPSNSFNPTLPAFLQPLANLQCRLSGRTTGFDQATLNALYPTHASYYDPVVHSVNRLVKARFMLPPDAAKVKAEAALYQVACGIGFELVLLLPPLMWLHDRRRTSRR
jgi:hypothetical protein